MKRKARQLFIFMSSVVVILGMYGLLMFGLKDFNDPSNASGIRFDDTGDDNRIDHPYLFEENNATFRDVGRAIGYLLWEAKGIDILIVGVVLFIASEATATIVKGFNEQCAEFRKEMCDTDKFVILQKKDVDELKEDKE